MKRFYKQAKVITQQNRFGVALDGKALRSPGGALLEVPTQALAHKIADEWNAVEETVNVNALVFTKLSNTAIDRGGPLRQDIIAELASFAQTDLICYRAESPDDLVALQSQHWDPVLRWMQEAKGLTLTTTTALIGHEQPKTLAAGVSKVLDQLSAFELTAVYNLVGPTRSLSIGLACAFGFLTAKEGWAAACVDERFQMSQWGADEEALSALTAKEQDFLAACAFWRCLQPDS